MRPDEIRELSNDDIKARVAELQEERFRLRFRSATEPLANPLQLRTIRRDIARLKTVLTERERAPREQGTGKREETERTKNG
jgi:large subunit ribosomal protein L29